MQNREFQIRINWRAMRVIAGIEIALIFITASSRESSSSVLHFRRSIIIEIYDKEMQKKTTGRRDEREKLAERYSRREISSGLICTCKHAGKRAQVPMERN